MLNRTVWSLWASTMVQASTNVSALWWLLLGIHLCQISKVFPHKISILASDNPKTQRLLGEMRLRPALGSHSLPLISSGCMAGARSDGLSLGLKPPRGSDTGSVLAHHPGACTASGLGAWWGGLEQAGLQCAAPCLWYHKELGSSRATHRVSVDRL